MLFRSCNGIVLSETTAVFATDDPGITIHHPGTGLAMELEILRITKEMAESIAGGIGETKGNHKKYKGLTWLYKS